MKLHMRRTHIGPLFAIVLASACVRDVPSGPNLIVDANVTASRAPLIEELDTPFTFTSPCPQGFMLINAGVAHTRQITFFDRSGVPTNTQVHFIIVATSVNSVSGKTLRNNSQFTIYTDLVTWVTTIIGGTMHITDNGKGILVRDAGRISFDANGAVIFEAGLHDFTNGDSVALRCEALA